MPFTQPPPKKPNLPPIQTKWMEQEAVADPATGKLTERFTGRLSYEAQRYLLDLDQYQKALNEYLAAMAAAIP